MRMSVGHSSPARGSGQALKLWRWAATCLVQSHEVLQPERRTCARATYLVLQRAAGATLAEQISMFLIESCAKQQI